MVDEALPYLQRFSSFSSLRVQGDVRELQSISTQREEGKHWGTIEKT